MEVEKTPSVMTPFLEKQSKTKQPINQLISQDVTLWRNAKPRIIPQGQSLSHQ